MGIDSIGKPKGPSATDLTSATSGLGDVSKIGSSETFQVKTSAVGEVQATTPLARLQAGKIDVDTYLDTKVSQATRHLEGKLAPEKLEWVRQALRNQLAQDPVLVDMVGRLTKGLGKATSDSR